MTQDTHDPIEQLREELRRVSVSQSFTERVRERLTDELEPLRAELADLNVSPEFAVRVRQRVEAPLRSSWGLTWRWIVPAAGLAAVVAAIVLWPRGVEPPAPAQTEVVAKAEPAAPPVVSSSGPRVASPVTVARTKSAAGPRQVAFSAQAETATSGRDPFLEVITDQPELLRRLVIAVERPDIAVDPSEPERMYEAPKLDVPKVEVSPVSLFVVPIPRVPVGFSPFILRIAADSAERSSK